MTLALLKLSSMILTLLAFSRMTLTLLTFRKHQNNFTKLIFNSMTFSRMTFSIMTVSKKPYSTKENYQNDPKYNTQLNEFKLILAPYGIIVSRKTVGINDIL